MLASLSTRNATGIRVAALHAPTAKQPDSRADPFPVPANLLLLRYIEGWAEADAVKIAAAVSTDYSFLDPLVGQFDRDSLHCYITILRQRAGLCSSRLAARKVELSAFPGSHWPARNLRFWRSLPESGLSGMTDIELRSERVCRDVVCYEPGLAVECLRMSAASAHRPLAAALPA
jgi:hypothetical protein